ncbi:L,D-transpeptidase [Leptotrichia sp. oral taxon 223]|uniref:L,D-transpeptidase n=1 Tax=Leptotrichia sp. oral taxon 223 TaxID=712363 RepID=UPI0015BF7FC9|nr:L,D-transpeptidase [Leptotrichia sp. oral taxon 223]
MTKKLDSIIEAGKEKLKMKKWKKMEIGVLALINTVIAFNASAEPLNMPKEYSENITVKGQEKDVFDYDFNSDGINEKVVVTYNLVDNLIGAVLSIYTNQGGKEILTYQVAFDKKFDILELQAMQKMLDKVKEYYPEYSKNIQPNETRYITIYGDNRNNDIIFDKIKFNNHAPENTNNFLFIKRASSMLNAPNGNAVAHLSFSEKPEILFDMVSDAANSQTRWYYTEFTKRASTNVSRKTSKDKNGKVVAENPVTVRGFIAGSEDNVSRRGFHWDKMIKKIEIVNKFIDTAVKANEELYIVTEYRPLSRDKPSEKDRFGNKNNQSIVGYTNSKKEGEKINIPDQSIFKIIGEENNMLKIETPFYGGPYFIEKNEDAYKKVENIKGEVNKFIAIDPNSQAEVLFQRIPETEKYEVVTYSYVTTGKDGWGSYETPHGAFLIAFTRPYMTFTRHAREGDKTLPGRSDLTIGGSARYAVRFSGGGYMHGIPVGLNFRGSTLNTGTAHKIGTYKDSHKCVRHFDDQIEFIVKWINADSKIRDRDNTIPEEPVIAVVL